MIVNGKGLLNAAPIVDMLDCKETFGGLSHGLTEAGYDIRIKQSIRFYPKGHSSNPLSDEDILYVDGRVLTGRFVLASAIEKFDMPKDLLGVVHDKSTWARKGLSVFNTVIEPGFKGGLTLELAYHGTEVLHVPAGAGIAQVIFSELTQEAEYKGKYQNQSTDPEPARFS